MYLLFLYFSLANCVFSAIFGRFLKINATIMMILYNLVCMIYCISFILYEVIVCDNNCTIELFDWIDVGILNLKMEFLFDIVSSLMLFVITLISTCVQIYAIEYMSKDSDFLKFVSYISLFTFFMIILVTAGNLLLLFIGWEGVGLCSYLLINYWYTRIAANKAAMKALIINKIGDICFLLAILLLFVIYYNSLEFSFINNVTYLVKNVIYFEISVFLIKIDYFLIILFLFVVGICAKSAQIGLHTWLPDAMEGPTPVSALIHAATMVTAGVFLLLRLIYLFKYNEIILLLIAILGGITSFIAATIGLFQNDIKKIIAYSTCSQLGYMILSCGLNNYSGSLFHLINHAFFKALLFLSAGAIIHSMFDQQDVRRLGMLLKYLPVSHMMILIGSLTIMGVPFLTGFYSKDFILEYTYSSNIYLSLFLYWLSIISAALTSFYSIKLLFLTFYNVHNSYFHVFYKKINNYVVIHESKFLMLFVLIILFFGSVFIGFILKDLLMGMGTDIWINTLDLESYHNNLKIFEVEFLSLRIKLIPVIFTVISGIISFLFFKFYIFIVKYLFIIYFYIFKGKNIKIINLKKRINFIWNVIYNGYYFNEIYNYFLYRKKKLSYIMLKNLDKGFIEFNSYLAVVNYIKNILYIFSKKNITRIDHIVFVIVLSIIIINLIYIYLLWNILDQYKILNFLILLLLWEIIYIKLWNNLKS